MTRVNFITAGLVLTALILLSWAELCAGAGQPQGAPLYRNIPGVTERETEAIEALREGRNSFIYAMNPTSEMFYDEDGEIRGYAALFCGWLTEMFGIPFEPAIYEWGDLVNRLESLEIDFSGELTATEERRKKYFMTDAITERPAKFMRIAGSEALSVIAAQRPLRFAFLRGTTMRDMVAPLIQDKFESFFIDDYEAAYRLLKNGDIDAFFEEGPAEAAFDSYGDVTAEEFFPLVYSPVSLTTQNPALRPIISVVQKALENGASRHLISLYNDGNREYMRHKLRTSLTETERLYVNNHTATGDSILIAAEYDNYPISFYNVQEGEWQGVAFDILREIEELTGLSFEVGHADLMEWPALLDALRNNEVSMITELIRSNEREGRFLWTDTPQQTDCYALISKAEFDDININEVLFSRVGLIQDSAYAEVFNEWFPGHQGAVTYISVMEAFDALTRGEVDLVMATKNLLLSLTNYMEQPGFKANIVFNRVYHSTFGFNIGEVPLRSVVDKSM
ncbi:MAG: transporter substrate-binding domain-containing protein, partial [Synergistaceae bacterium]|nr:transporter substrate-binding domain-containing protein [Synergistaceae bacterium]